MKIVKFLVAVAVLFLAHASFADSGTAAVATDVKTQEKTKVCTQKSTVNLWDNTNPTAQSGVTATQGRGTVQ
jgi:hypothetical protein